MDAGPFLRLWVATMLLAGCAGPLPWQLPAPIPSATSAGAPLRWQAPLPHGGKPAELVHWWASFEDPLVPKLVDAAQAAQPSLASAAARVAQARAEATVAGAALLPRVDAQLAAQRYRDVPDALSTKAYSEGLSMSWEVDLFGAAAAGRDAALARVRASEAGWHDARVLVAAEVVQQYLSLRACEAQLALAESDARSRAETDRLTTLLKQAGLQSPGNAALAHASSAQGRSAVTARRATCDSLVKVLVELTAWDEIALRAALSPGRGVLPEPPAVPVAGLPAELLAQRPDVGRAADNVQAAAAALTQARAQRLPQLSISGTLGSARVSSGPLFENGRVWSYGPVQLSLPIFDGDRLKAAQDNADALYREAEALLKARVRTAVREVEDALVTLHAAGERGDDVRAAAEGYQASLRAIEGRFGGGLASLFELEDARRTAAQAEVARIDWQREQAAAWIALYRALGGGWKADAEFPRAGT